MRSAPPKPIYIQNTRPTTEPLLSQAVPPCNTSEMNFLTFSDPVFQDDFVSAVAELAFNPLVSSGEIDFAGFASAYDSTTNPGLTLFSQQPEQQLPQTGIIQSKRKKKAANKDGDCITVQPAKNRKDGWIYVDSIKEILHKKKKYSYEKVPVGTQIKFKDGEWYHGNRQLMALNAFYNSHTQNTQKVMVMGREYYWDSICARHYINPFTGLPMERCEKKKLDFITDPTKVLYHHEGETRKVVFLKEKDFNTQFPAYAKKRQKRDDEETKNNTNNVSSVEESKVEAKGDVEDNSNTESSPAPASPASTYSLGLTLYPASGNKRAREDGASAEVEQSKIPRL